jgi:dTDP-4-dehydrorhamnose 3,5-epimerase-like enzyme
MYSYAGCSDGRYRVHCGDDVTEHSSITDRYMILQGVFVGSPDFGDSIETFGLCDKCWFGRHFDEQPWYDRDVYIRFPRKKDLFLIQDDYRGND